MNGSGSGSGSLAFTRAGTRGTPGTAAAAGFAVAGPLGGLSDQHRAIVFDRGRATDPAVERAVRGVIDDVRERGDEALREMALRFDGARLETLEVSGDACRRALEALAPDVRSALEQAADNIAAFHRAQLPEPLEIELQPGLKLGRRADPLRRVGVYAPGGRAAYPSSVLMGVVAARVAGVEEVIVCSPPGPDGLPPQTVLAACALAGADRVFALGGAGAVAALALGTGTVPRVEKIVGPGNAYVTEAKRQLTGLVAIDSPAGPSEILIIADGTADATLVAAELIAQAEHDPDAAAVLVTTACALCGDVAAEVERLLEAQPRADIIRAALAARGALLHCGDMRAAVRFAEEYAPEHLLVMTAEPRALLPELRAAGTIFLGAPSSVAFGDYITGANHVLPTAGLARAHAGLSTLDFLRWSTYQELSAEAAAALAPPTIVLAEAEGLPAHALAAQLRSRGAATASGQPWRMPRRPGYDTVVPYDPGRAPCDVDLSDNTNLFGPAPSVSGELAGLPAARITRYPSVYATDLKCALARLYGVEPENVTTGCGSDDVIDSALRAFCNPGDAVAYPDPTFGMVPVFARMNTAKPVAVPLGADFELDPDALLAARATVTYICRPNNPTGTLFDRAATLRLLRRAEGVLLVDEAYADYAGEDLAPDVVASDRGLVLRTFSKAFGAAGLRIGFALGAAPLIAEVEKSRGPYKVGGAAEAAALALLAGDMGWVRERAAETARSRDRLAAALRDRGVQTWASAANFVLAAVPGAAAEWNGRLRAQGVAVRPFARIAGRDCIRITAGPWPLMERFLAAFDRVSIELQNA